MSCGEPNSQAGGYVQGQEMGGSWGWEGSLARFANVGVQQTRVTNRFRKFPVKVEFSKP